MTVSQVFDDGDVACKWFAGSKLNSGIFPGEVLQKADVMPSK
jgi:uncharacterized protein YodC (DUF2158 family)